MQQSYETSYKAPATGIIKWLAWFISVVFHPLFLPVYVTFILLFVHPLAFAGTVHYEKVMKLMAVIFSVAFLPAFAVLLMKLLGFISSVTLKTQRERIIPYAAAIIFYFWIWYVFKNQPYTPDYFVKFLLGCFLGVCAAWMLNIRMKISMHGIGVGGVLMFFLLQVLFQNDDTGIFLAAALLMTGLVCTARLLISDHTKAEIYLGVLAGMLCQLIAWYV